MSVLKIKDQNNDWIQIPTIKGDKGDPFTYADFTPEQLESLKGKDGISPTVSVASDTSDDYRLSFTDETHTVTTPNLIPEAEKIFDVYPHDTASGSIASFPDGEDNIPLKSCIIQVEPVQEGSGDPSPDNVRPITGWTGCEVNRTGKNLYDFADISIAANVQENIFLSEYIDMKAGTYTISYTLDKTVTATRNRPAYATKNGIYIYGDPDIKTAGRGSWTFTLASDTTLKLFWWNHMVSEACTISDIQLELGSTATAYEPYTGQTYPITFPASAGTVYGAYVDVTGGELVVDRAMVDLGTKNWLVVSNNNYATFSCTNIFINAVYNDKIPTLICSAYKSVANNIASPTDDNYVWFNAQKVLRLKDTKRKDLTKEQFKAAMSGVQLVYELAEPIHYPITPQEIKTLLGTNNIWVNTGDTEVEYRASTKMYIDRKIAEAVAAALNS